MTNHRNQLIWRPLGSALMVVIAASVVVGCRRVEQLPVAPARGIVLLDNHPLPAANVVFIPERGRSATAQSNTDGTFVLTTYESGDGAIVGSHHVTVTAREPGEANMPGAPGVKRAGRSLIPEHYGNTATSGLTFEIASTGENVFEIQLSSKSIR